MKKKLMMMAAALLVGAMSSYGALVAAWDLSSSKTMSAGLPTGWTNWSNGALVTNHTPVTYGALTLTHGSTNTANPFASVTTFGSNTGAINVYSNEASLYPFADVTNSQARNVSLDGICSLGDAKKTTLTLSGLAIGQQYRIQFIGGFNSMSPLTNQYIDVTQDGVATNRITTEGFGDSTLPRVIFSSYYTFTATAGDTDVQFGFVSGSGNQDKNGIAGVMVYALEQSGYLLSVANGSGSGLYDAGQQAAISANQAPSGKIFREWIGDTQYVDNVTSSNATVTMPAMPASLTATYIYPVSEGTVVAAWDFTSASTGTVDSGWTTWSTADMSNMTANTVGSLTLSDSYIVVNGTGITCRAAAIPSFVWEYQATPLLVISNGSTGIYADHITSMSGPKFFTLTLSGLEAGSGYEIQFVSLFQAYYLSQAIKVTQDGVPAADLNGVFGSTNIDRVAYSDYYMVTNKSSTVFVFDGGTTGNVTKNGLAGMIVKKLGPSGPTLYTLTVNGGDGDGSYTNGAVVNITADAPATGKTFDVWTGDTQYVASVSSSNTTVTMPAQAVALTATYKDLVYTLTGNADANGAVTPSSTNVVYNGNADFVVTASNYYRIASLTTNGTAVIGMTFDNDSTTTNFTWSNVLADGTLAATFTAQLATDPAGTPYSWLAGYGLTNYDADAVADQDADGLKTWQEYIAGTDPTSKASCLKVAQTNRNTVTWSPVAGRVYSVYWSTNLVKGFTNLASGIQYPQGSYTNTTPDAKVNHYQVRVQLP